MYITIKEGGRGKQRADKWRGWSSVGGLQRATFTSKRPDLIRLAIASRIVLQLTIPQWIFHYFSFFSCLGRWCYKVATTSRTRSKDNGCKTSVNWTASVSPWSSFRATLSWFLVEAEDTEINKFIQYSCYVVNIFCACGIPRNVFICGTITVNRLFFMNAELRRLPDDSIYRRFMGKWDGPGNVPSFTVSPQWIRNETQWNIWHPELNPNSQETLWRWNENNR